MTDSIIIKSNILMHPNDEDALRKRILSQMQEGVVIIPEYCELVYPEYKVIEQIRAEIEQLSGNEYEVADYQGNRYAYEDINKADVLQIIDKHMKEAEHG